MTPQPGAHRTLGTVDKSLKDRDEEDETRLLAIDRIAGEQVRRAADTTFACEPQRVGVPWDQKSKRERWVDDEIFVAVEPAVAEPVGYAPTSALLDSSERAALFGETGAARGVANTIIEKDFWVCWTLKRLFELATQIVR